MNARSVGTLTLVTLALLLAACPKQVETKPEPVSPRRLMPPLIRVPGGCEAVIEGRFTHSQNPAYRYSAQDDGGTLTLLVERFSADGGLLLGEDGGTVISLNRTPNGFNGSTTALVFTQRGARCHVSFPTDVIACGDGGLLLRSAVSGSVDEQCRAPARLPPAARVEHRLVRVVDTTPFAERKSTDAGVVSATVEPRRIPFAGADSPVVDPRRRSDAGADSPVVDPRRRSDRGADAGSGRLTPAP